MPSQSVINEPLGGALLGLQSIGGISLPTSVYAKTDGIQKAIRILTRAKVTAQVNLGLTGDSNSYGYGIYAEWNKNWSNYLYEVLSPLQPGASDKIATYSVQPYGYGVSVVANIPTDNPSHPVNGRWFGTMPVAVGPFSFPQMTYSGGATFNNSTIGGQRVAGYLHCRTAERGKVFEENKDRCRIVYGIGQDAATSGGNPFPVGANPRGLRGETLTQALFGASFGTVTVDVMDATGVADPNTLLTGGTPLQTFTITAGFNGRAFCSGGLICNTEIQLPANKDVLIRMTPDATSSGFILEALQFYQSGLTTGVQIWDRAVSGRGFGNSRSRRRNASTGAVDPSFGVDGALRDIFDRPGFVEHFEAMKFAAPYTDAPVTFQQSYQNGNLTAGASHFNPNAQIFLVRLLINDLAGGAGDGLECIKQYVRDHVLFLNQFNTSSTESVYILDVPPVRPGLDAGTLDERNKWYYGIGTARFKYSDLISALKSVVDEFPATMILHDSQEALGNLPPIADPARGNTKGLKDTKRFYLGERSTALSSSYGDFLHPDQEQFNRPFLNFVEMLVAGV